MKRCLVCILILLSILFSIVPSYSIDSDKQKEQSYFSVITTTLDKLLFPAVRRYIKESCKDETPETMDFNKFETDLRTLVTSLCRIYNIPITKPPQIVVLEATKNTIVNHVVWLQLYCIDLDEPHEDIPLNFIIGKGFTLFSTTLSEKLPVNYSM